MMKLPRAFDDPSFKWKLAAGLIVCYVMINHMPRILAKLIVSFSQ